MQNFYFGYELCWVLFDFNGLDLFIYIIDVYIYIKV